jgi:hypothetical protein
MDTCPLCGTSVALLRHPDRRSKTEQLRAQISTLRERAAQLERGEVTPRMLKDAALWLCAACQGIMVGTPRLDGQELRRRIHEEVRELERRGVRAS